MAFLANGTPTPTPTPAPTASAPTQQQIMAMFAGVQGGGTADQAVVPLWLVRPTHNVAPRKYGQGFTEGNDGDFARTEPISSGFEASTKAAAEAYWFDMSDAERKAFAEKAIKAGVWEPKDGAAALAGAWGRAVDMAAAYNEAHASNQKKWLSPFEALEKLYGAGVAAGSGTVDGFKPYAGWREHTYKSSQKFTEGDIEKTAQQILQQELGRDPTAAELKAYTIAANRGAAANPQTVTERTRDTAWDEAGRPIDSETQRSVSGDPYDPSMDIQGSARNTAEHRQVKAATDYFSAAMQAINAIA